MGNHSRAVAVNVYRLAAKHNDSQALFQLGRLAHSEFTGMQLGALRSRARFRSRSRAHSPQPIPSHPTTFHPNPPHFCFFQTDEPTLNFTLIFAFTITPAPSGATSSAWWRSPLPTLYAFCQHWYTLVARPSPTDRPTEDPWSAQAQARKAAAFDAMGYYKACESVGGDGVWPAKVSFFGLLNGPTAPASFLSCNVSPFLCLRLRLRLRFCLRCHLRLSVLTLAHPDTHRSWPPPSLRFKWRFCCEVGAVK